MMKHSVVLLAAVIFLLSQCIQGAVYLFNTKRNTAEHLEPTKYSNIFSTIDGYVDDGEPVSPKLRARRQDTGGNPKAYSYNLAGDSHQYALPLYPGKGSKVNVVALICQNVFSPWATGEMKVACIYWRHVHAVYVP